MFGNRKLHKVASGAVKTVMRGAAGLMVAVSLFAAGAEPASARGGWDPGAAAAVGVIGGLALGAALSQPAPAYAVPYAYAPEYPRWHRHHYVGWAPPPADCYVVRERIWVPGWGWDIRPRTVCD
jgi:hypothetical protein